MCRSRPQDFSSEISSSKSRSQAFTSFGRKRPAPRGLAGAMIALIGNAVIVIDFFVGEVLPIFWLLWKGIRGFDKELENKG
jgi:hypothetical protein